MKNLVIFLSLCLGLTAGACASGKTGTPQQVRAAQNEQVYQIYRQYMEARNQERQRAGLPPAAVKSYEEFRRSPGTD